MVHELDAAASEAARRAMVDRQVRPADVTSRAVTDAMLSIPRELFVPKARRAQAYVGEHIPLSESRVELDPQVFARMANAAEAGPEDLVLVVGGGHGYAAAVFAAVAAAAITLESDAAMVKASRDALAKAGIDTVIQAEGPLIGGCAEHSPYNLIFLNGATEIDPPAALVSQLAEDGRFVILRRDGPVGRCEIGVRAGDGIAWRPIFDAVAPTLPGFESTAGFTF